MYGIRNFLGEYLKNEATLLIREIKITNRRTQLRCLRVKRGKKKKKIIIIS